MGTLAQRISQENPGGSADLWQENPDLSPRAKKNPALFFMKRRKYNVRDIAYKSIYSPATLLYQILHP